MAETTGVAAVGEGHPGRPLAGCRVLVTRPEGRGGDLLALLGSLGAWVEHVPLIRTEPPDDPALLRQAAAQAWSGAFDWAVVTSAEGARALASALRSTRPPEARGGQPLRLCAVGPATRQAAEEEGLAVAAVPARAQGAAIPDALEWHGPLAGRRVLVAVADRADDRLPAELARRGARVARVTAYRTVPDPPAAARAAALLRRGLVDVVVLASPSAVEALAGALEGPEGAAPVRAAAIGPTTAEAARRRGFEVEQAAQPTASGVAGAVLRLWQAHRP